MEATYVSKDDQDKFASEINEQMEKKHEEVLKTISPIEALEKFREAAQHSINDLKFSNNCQDFKIHKNEKVLNDIKPKVVMLWEHPTEPLRAKLQYVQELKDKVDKLLQTEPEGLPKKVAIHWRFLKPLYCSDFDRYWERVAPSGYLKLDYKNAKYAEGP